MKFFIFICALTIFSGRTSCQDDLDLASLLASTFPDAVEASSTPGPHTPVVTGGVADTNLIDEVPEEDYGDCECVPYYQCNTNQTIIENGEGLIDIRMKSGPCEDYLDVCCKTGETLSPGETITPSPSPLPNPTSSSCGKRNINGISSLRITGATDNEAQFGEFPWMVAITRKEEIDGNTVSVYQCGGSLLSSSTVLTAAHCVKGKTGLTVRAGEWDTQRKTEPLPTQSREVQQIVTHEQYHAGTLRNDVALLLLDPPLELAPNVGTICLPEPDENMDGRQCVASGWGKDVFGKDGKYQVILKKVELPIVSREPCIEALRKTRLGQHFKLHESFICAGGIPGKDTCKGDGGGPLTCPSISNPQIYVQAGIVAWGIGCGTETPGVYVNVAHFRTWIDEKMTAININPRRPKQVLG